MDISFVVADKVERHFLKGLVSVGGYFSCEVCTGKGVHRGASLGRTLTLSTARSERTTSTRTLQGNKKRNVYDSEYKRDIFVT